MNFFKVIITPLEIRTFCYLKKKRAGSHNPLTTGCFITSLQALDVISHHTLLLSLLYLFPEKHYLWPVTSLFCYIPSISTRSPDKIFSSQRSINAVYKHWQYCTYFIGKKKVESQKKCHKSNQHASRSLTEPLQEPWFALTYDFNMLFSAACVRELMKINKSAILVWRGKAFRFKTSLLALLALLPYREPLALDQNFPTLIKCLSTLLVPETHPINKTPAW